MPPAPTPIEQALAPFQRFVHTQSSSGLVLMACTVVALAWANSPWGAEYFALWNTPFSVSLGGVGLAKPVLLWINDGLMAVFFFLVGLEIKREVLAGELNAVSQAMLPTAAALGGMIVPALLFAAFNLGGPGADGWGIPMATDIAFALGILALLGDRVPLQLKVFLTAVAIVDDIGAVLVIALFYTSQVSLVALGAAAVLFIALLALNLLGARQPQVYFALGVLMWLALLKSGVHATVAGILTAATVPANTRINFDRFLGKSRSTLDSLEVACQGHCGPMPDKTQLGHLENLETACLQANTPLQRIEHGLHPWVAFLVMPVFALANAGVQISGELAATLGGPVSLGVLAGLLVGKPLGVLAGAWLVLRSGVAGMPAGLTWRHLFGASLLAGIGFTMAIFVAGLAYPEGSPANETAKLAILLASAVAGVAGYLVLRKACPAPRSA